MNMRKIVSSSLTVFCVACLSTNTYSSEPTYFSSESTKALGLPFSDAVQVGDLLFLSGQLGNIPGEMKLAPGGIEAEARQTMDNIRTVLKAHSLDMQDLVKCTVFLADIAEWPAFNKVYAEYFDTHFPARSALAASGLALGARVEVECIASASQVDAK